MVQDIPALIGGQPAFEEKLPIIRPTLVEFSKLEEDFSKIWQSGMITSGQYVRRLEDAVAAYVGARFAVGVANCTSGLILALHAVDPENGVVLPSFTFTATAHAVVWNALEPVFVDCDRLTKNISADAVRRTMMRYHSEAESHNGSGGSRPSAVLAVDIFGVPPEIEELEEVSAQYNVPLIFDSAQSLGATYKGQRTGVFGSAQVFSMSPTKVITAGEGGVVTTNDQSIADFVRRGRDYGKAGDGSDIEFIGLSARMSEFHAAIALRNLEHVDELIAHRLGLIDLYRERLSCVPGVKFQHVPKDVRPSGNYMVIFVQENGFGLTRDQLCAALDAENIQTKKYFHPALHLQNAYSSYRAQYEGRLPNTENASSTGLALPLYGHMEEDIALQVCEAIDRVHRYSEDVRKRLEGS